MTSQFSTGKSSERRPSYRRPTVSTKAKNSVQWNPGDNRWALVVDPTDSDNEQNLDDQLCDDSAWRRDTICSLKSKTDDNDVEDEYYSDVYSDDNNTAADSDSEDDDVDVSVSNRYTFNVGGRRFQTMKSTFADKRAERVHAHDPDTFYKLCIKLLEPSNLDTECREFFFNRDPAAFEMVLGYVRTGVLHVPEGMCSPSISRELEFWGLPRLYIEPCCWVAYSVGLQSQQNFKTLLNDRSRNTTKSVYARESMMHLGGIDMKKKKLFNFLNDTASTEARLYFGVSMFLVMLSVATYMLRSLAYVRALEERQGAHHILRYTHGQLADDEYHYLIALAVCDMLVLAFFVFDLLANLYCSPNRRRYIFSFRGAVDTIPLMPDIYDLMEISFDIGGGKNAALYINLMKSLRAFKVFRLVERLRPLWIVKHTLLSSLKDLGIMLLLLIITVIVFSGIMYYTESNSRFKSIPHSFWWGIITMTRVGYGDLVPESVPGKIICSLSAFAGILVLGLMIPPLSNNFTNFNENLAVVFEKDHSVHGLTGGKGCYSCRLYDKVEDQKEQLYKRRDALVVDRLPHETCSGVVGMRSRYIYGNRLEKPYYDIIP